MRYSMLTAAAALFLAGCGDAGDGNTSVSIDNGSGVDAARGVSIDAPGFKASFDLPDLKIDAKDFSLNGVPLYPGSAIGAMNIDADAARSGGTVRVDFTSPATPAVVRDWFRERLTRAGFTLSDTGGGLSGTTDEGKPFRMELSPLSGGRAKGRISVTG